MTQPMPRARNEPRDIDERALFVSAGHPRADDGKRSDSASVSAPDSPARTTQRASPVMLIARTDPDYLFVLWRISLDRPGEARDPQ